MSESELYLDLLLVTTAAFVGGAVAQLLRLPTIVGFLVAGIAIGPNGLGPVGDIESIGRAADLGVILLMFGVGMHLSFRQLIEQRRVLLLGGGLQIILTLLIGFAAGEFLGFSSSEALVLGFISSISSTMVAVKVLEGRQETRTAPAIAAINVLIFQDLAAVVMVITVPAIGGGGFDPTELALAMGKGLLLIGATYVLSVYVLPQIWRRIAYSRSRDLSLLGALTLAVGLAAGSGLLGLSIAFGAFLAGLAVSENAYGHATLSDVIPLREIFASVFFVLIGMLAQPEVLWHETETVIAILLVITLGKALVSAAALRLVGLSLGSAIVAGLVLAQVGEFSFVISRVALDEGVINQALESSFLAAAIISILLNPFLVWLGPAALARLSRTDGLRTMLQGAPAVLQAETGQIESLGRHVIICGYGSAAAAVVRSLRGRGLAFVVIENNPLIFDAVRQLDDGVPFIFGDATRPEVLELARVKEARILAVTFESPADAPLAVANAKSLNPSLDVVARGAFASHTPLRHAGSSEVVDPGFETSLEFVRHVLHRYGVDAREIGAMQLRWRAEHYNAD